MASGLEPSRKPATFVASPFHTGLTEHNQQFVNNKAPADTQIRDSHGERRAWSFIHDWTLPQKKVAGEADYLRIV